MMERFSTLARLLAGSGSGSRPDPLAVVQPGMPMQIDITPFVLAGSALATAMPVSPSVVTAVSRVQSRAAIWHRIHLGDHYLQLDLGEGGGVRECRYFGKFDEINPGSAADWGFWLAAEDGSIGYPVFQVPDGREYPRFWMAGSTRIAPVNLTEQLVKVASGPLRQIDHQAMLYARATGQGDPAPATEYLMLSAVRDGGQAWVQIHTGIDLNPQVLTFL